MTDLIKWIITIAASIALIALIIFVEEWRLSSVKTSLQNYEAIHAQDTQAVADAKDALQRAVSDSKKANDLLAARAVAAEKTAHQNALRYQQIMGVKNAEDAPVSPVLRDSLERLRGTTATSPGH